MRQADSTAGVLPEVAHGGRFAGDRPVALHSHPGTELVLVTRGCCRTSAGDTWLAGGVGTLFVLPAGAPQMQEGAVHTTYVTFTPVPRLFPEEPRTIAVPAGDPVATWLEQLVDLLGRPPATWGMVCNALLLTILHRLRALEQHRQETAHLHPAVAAALTILEADSGAALSRGDLARRVGVSASHLGALFRAQTGSTLGQYREHLRLGQAEALLRNPRLDVAAVAAACGFADPNYFSRRFRQLHGLSPGRWRATRQGAGSRSALSVGSLPTTSM